MHSSSPPTTHSSESALHTVGKSVSDLIADWKPGVVFDAQQVLAENPEFIDDHSVILDLAYEEYCQRTELGEEINPSDFVGRFSTVESSLLDMIEVHQVLYDHPSTLTNGDTPRWPEVGESHLDLKLLEKIGSGSFSQVYIASEHGVGERRVVAKLCSNANHEASLLGRLEHPNIVPILSVKTDSQRNLSAICMPYKGRTTLAHAIDLLKGLDLRTSAPADLVKMLAEREPDSSSAHDQKSEFSRRSQLQEVMIDIAIQLCSGLEFAHQQGVIHGDLKPSNILLTRQGSALLMDFNLSQHSLPDSQAIGGTLAYMAPEQLEILATTQRTSNRPVICNEQTDIYSFGVLLVELFTGTHPFSTTAQPGSQVQSAKSLYQQQQTKPVTEGVLGTRIEPSLARIIEKSLAFDPLQRWRSTAELRAALEKTISPQKRFIRRIRRDRKLTAGILLGICTLSFSGLLYAYSPTETEKKFAKANNFLAAGEREAAIPLLESLKLVKDAPSRLIPLLGRTHFESGRQALDDGDYPLAVHHLEQARLNTPQIEGITDLLGEAHSRLGENAVNEGRFEDAISELNLARDLTPDSLLPLRPLSHALIAQKNYEEALEVIREWRSRHEMDAAPQASMGYCYLVMTLHNEGLDNSKKIKNYQVALALLEHALAMTGDVSKAAILNDMGLCYIALGKYDRALEQLQSASNRASELDNEIDRLVPFVNLLRADRKRAYASRILPMPDLQLVDDCLAVDPESVELLLESACSYALASMLKSSDPELSDHYLERCLEYCKRASNAGITSTDLTRVQSFQSRLNDREEWKLLHESAITSRTAVYDVALNPLQ